MIYELGRNLEDALRAKKYPIRIVYGESYRDVQITDPVILLDRDRQIGDLPPMARSGSGTPAPGAGPQQAAGSRYKRELGAVARIFMRSELEGAHAGDHERSCDQLVDAFLTELELWGEASRAGWIPVGTTRYMTPDEIGQVTSQAFVGVAYLVQFRVPRGVQSLDYTREGRPQAVLDKITSRTNVRAQTPPDPVDPETGCGG